MNENLDMWGKGW